MTPTAPGRTDRRYLMCEPIHYTVSYEINPWMDKTRYTDADLAVRQWRTLRDTYLDLGHTVETIDPIPGLPDMVYAANGATVLDGVVYSAQVPLRRAPARGPRVPEVVRRPRLRHAHRRADQRGRGRPARRRRPGPGRHRLPHRPRRARRAPGALRPPGHLARPGQPALLPPRHRAGRAVERPGRPADRVLPAGVLGRLARGPAAAVPRRRRGHRARRRRPRAQRGVRRLQRRRRPRRGRPGRRHRASAATTPSPWTPASCSRAAAAPSAARSRSGPRPAPGDDSDRRRDDVRPRARTTTRCPSRWSTGSGSWVTDDEGRRYLDLLSGYSALNFGHRHPVLTAAAHAQIDKLTLTSRAFDHELLEPFAARARRADRAAGGGSARWCCR